MRPLRLTMRAFGPYADTQTVDFTEALKVGLFGVYGPTGAGKSSIFSAIAFALFGAPAKGEQDLTTLRSHHAAPDVVTEVQLVFDVGAKRYFIKRRPEQVRPKKHGDGETKEAHSAWLFDASGLDLQDISDTNPGKALAEKKVSEVGQKMQEILGYTAEHFRQIVLLPQGEFEKFLVAKTDDRLKILRQLFDVTLFQQLAKKLKDDAARAGAKINGDRSLFMRLLETEGCSSLEGLQAAATQAQTDAVTLKPILAGKNTAAQQAAAALGEARQLAKRFQDLEAATSALAKLQAKGAEIEAAQRTLAGARLAHGLADVDLAVDTARRRLAVAEQSRKSARQKNDAAKTAAATTVAALAGERARDSERVAQVAHGNALQRYAAILDGAVAQRVTVANAQNAVDEAARAHGRDQKAHNALVSARKAKAAELATAEQNVRARTELTTEIQTKDQAHVAAQQYEQATKHFVEAQAAETRARGAAGEANTAEADAEALYLEAERRLSEVQAIHLAEKLVDGEACPVCGSHDHPTPAMGDASSAGLDEAFRAAKTDWEAARRAHGAAREKLAAATASTIDRRAARDAMAIPAAPARQLAAELRVLQDRLAALGAAPNIQALKDAIANGDEQIEAAATTVETARVASDDAKTKLALAQQALATALADIPADLRTSDALAAATEATNQAIARLQAALDTAVTSERKAGEAAVAAAAELANADKAVVDAGDDLKQEQATFDVRLATVGLDAERYGTHKANIGRIDALQQDIAAHEQALAAAQAKLDHAKQHVEGVERPDLAALQQANDESAKARDETATKEADARTKATHLANQHTKLLVDAAAIVQAETAFKPLGAVADALNGINSQRMDIEAFAMATMFDRVLEHANLRLTRMTGGRYTLQRGVEGRGSSRRGLDIVVNDAFTGRSRPPISLSGGETFQAALALALGLSDVVESLSGGIKLDMIFIDEGFGSLDGQTLDEALQTLQDLVGQSRALGLISHVPAVQEAIPHGFQIEKTMTGSAIRQRRPS